MPSLHRRTSWGQTKPPVGYGVDWGDPISRGLVGCWLFNEGAGNRVRDIARGNDGTLTNRPTWSPGKFGQTVSFDGVNDYVQLSATDTLFKLSSPGSISFLIKSAENTANASVMGNNSFGTADGWEIALGSANKLYINRDHLFSSVFTTNSVIFDNRWHRVVLTTDGTNLAWYVDGVSSGISTLIDYTTNSNIIRIMSRLGGFGREIIGILDDIRIYNRALSAQEVMRLYTEPFAGIETPRRRIISLAAAGGLAYPPWLLVDTNEIVGANQS